MVRLKSTQMTIASASSAYHLASTVACVRPARCEIARQLMTRAAPTSSPASPRAARCSAFPWPYAWPGSAGRRATPTAKKVRSAAIRSVPECAASERRPRLCVAMPVTSFNPLRAIAASTEKSAVRRCGVMAESYSGLEVAAERLLALDRLEEGLEGAAAEAARAMALDHLEEDGRPVLRGLREDLEEVPVVVAVGEDLVLAQIL